MSLVLVGVFLGALGLADLARAARDVTTRTRRLACVALGGVTVLAGVLLVRPGAGWGLVLFALLGAALWVWVSASSAATASPSAGRRRTGRALALGALGFGLLVALLGAQAVDQTVLLPGWLDVTVAARWPLADLVVALGVTAAQLATANIVVRLVLDAVGVPATSNEKRLKGGRLLGPMERLFIVGLGGAGALTAAAVVVAAKGLLRFPELQSAHAAGPSDVTEYFLIGSFASWLIAFAGVAVIVLA